MASKKRKKKPVYLRELQHSPTIAELPAACANEAAGVEFFERKRWGDSPCCPECGDVNCYKMTDRKTGERNKDFRWRCRGCGKLYTVRTGMIFEESLVPMHKWARAMWEMATCKNGISALELSRKLEVSYKTALFMANRLRFAMAHDPDTDPKLSGTLEADETYWGGKPRHRLSPYRPYEPGDHCKRPNRKYSGRSRDHKTPIFAVVQRGGEVRVRVVPDVTGETLRAALMDHTEPAKSLLMTDEFKSYIKLGRPFAGHETVEHTALEYVRGNVHTNTVEGFFSRVKRKLIGTHHAVSKQHLHRYVSEAAFLYNTRRLNDGERVLALLRRTDGKRLQYRQPA